MITNRDKVAIISKFIGGMSIRDCAKLFDLSGPNTEEVLREAIGQLSLLVSKDKVPALSEKA